MESVALIDGITATRRFWRGRRVLVTGHTGFKGTWLSSWLRRLDARAAGFALKPNTTPNAFELSGIAADVDSTIGDIRDKDALAECFARFRPEVVFHLAAQALVRAGYADPLGTYGTNAIGTANVVLAARSCESVRAAVVVTSDKCYDSHAGSPRHVEDDPLGGDEPYSASKACAELIVASLRAISSARADLDMRVAVVRAGNVIGGGDWSADRLVPDAVRAFVTGRALDVRFPNAIRPWQYVLDPLGAYLDIARRLCGDDGQAFARAWNLGPGPDHEHTVAWIADRFAAAWGAGAAWRAATGGHEREAETLRLDSAAAARHMGWRSRTTLAETVDRTVAWYRAQADGAPVASLIDEELARFESLAA